jgi:adenylylsulfate kinase-like enzyme
MHKKGTIYWFTGQRGVGKTVLANKLKDFLQTQKRNWRKDVFLIDSEHHSQLGEAQIISTFLLENNCDVVVAITDASKQHRDEFKALINDRIIELYVHSNRKKSKELTKVTGYEAPTENFFDIDTTSDNPTQSFTKLIHHLGKVDKL